MVCSARPAYTLLELDRPDLGDAREGRALALKRLGRDAEAEAAFRLHLATIARSGARVRNAGQ
jgi:Flp pilus assembly protein TadD